MSNSDNMAEAMLRETEREILDDLKNVLIKHDLELVVVSHSDTIRIVQSNRNIIRTIHGGKLDVGNITL